MGKKKVLVRKFCTACNGRGKIWAGREEFECAFCHGKGFVEVEEEVEDDKTADRLLLSS